MLLYEEAAVGVVIDGKNIEPQSLRLRKGEIQELASIKKFLGLKFEPCTSTHP
jgi:hypothetical protein